MLEYAGKWLMQSDSVSLSPQKFGAEVHSQETGFPLSGLLPKFKRNVLRLPRDSSNRSQ